MRIPRIYTTQALASGQTVLLEEGPSHHLAKVLRMTEGRPIVLFNGDGNEYSAEISEVKKKVVSAAVHSVESPQRESPLHTHLAIALSKGDRFEWVLQKATELGVTQITPLFTERTDVKLSGERLEKKVASWQQVIISACEQCQRNVLPVFHTPMPFDAFVTSCDAERKLVLHHRSDATLDPQQPPHSVALLIGPEGGLSESEIHAAEHNGFASLTLGPRVLRTETAPIAALSALQFVWGDF